MFANHYQVNFRQPTYLGSCGINEVRSLSGKHFLCVLATLFSFSVVEAFFIKKECINQDPMGLKY